MIPDGISNDPQSPDYDSSSTCICYICYDVTARAVVHRFIMVILHTCNIAVVHTCIYQSGTTSPRYSYHNTYMYLYYNYCTYIYVRMNTYIYVKQLAIQKLLNAGPILLT